MAGVAARAPPSPFFPSCAPVRPSPHQYPLCVCLFFAPDCDCPPPRALSLSQHTSQRRRKGCQPLPPKPRQKRGARGPPVCPLSNALPPNLPPQQHTPHIPAPPSDQTNLIPFRPPPRRAAPYPLRPHPSACEFDARTALPPGPTFVCNTLRCPLSPPCPPPPPSPSIARALRTTPRPGRCGGLFWSKALSFSSCGGACLWGGTLGGKRKGAVSPSQDRATGGRSSRRRGGRRHRELPLRRRPARERRGGAGDCQLWTRCRCCRRTTAPTATPCSCAERAAAGRPLRDGPKVPRRRTLDRRRRPPRLRRRCCRRCRRCRRARARGPTSRRPRRCGAAVRSLGAAAGSQGALGGRRRRCRRRGWSRQRRERRQCDAHRGGALAQRRRGEQLARRRPHCWVLPVAAGVLC